MHGVGIRQGVKHMARREGGCSHVRMRRQEGLASSPHLLKTGTVVDSADARGQLVDQGYELV